MGPVPQRARTRPPTKLDSAEHTVSTRVTMPADSSGWPSDERMVGQATPSTLSGKPRLMKAR